MHLEMTIPLSTTGSLGAMYLLLAHLILRFPFLVCTWGIKLNPGPYLPPSLSPPPLLSSLPLSPPLPPWKGPAGILLETKHLHEQTWRVSVESA